jgi:uncharacterized protein
MMEILAYPAAVVMGILLGLIGGGGSILTLPVLVYMLHIPASEATFYSLFVVGLAAATGATDYVRNKFVCWRTVLFFGTPSLLATWFSRSYIFQHGDQQRCVYPRAVCLVHAGGFGFYDSPAESDPQR